MTENADDGVKELWGMLTMLVSYQTALIGNLDREDDTTFLNYLIVDD